MVQNNPPKCQSDLSKLAQLIYENPPPNGVDLPLAKISEHDKVWDTHRNQTDKVSKIYALSSEFERYSERLGACSGFLWFGFENGLKLKSAPFCHVRGCPVCQWRKSLFWKAMMYQTYDQIKELYPSHRWLFLTLTVENCPIGELRETLNHMNKSWKKLTKRKEFALVDGWIRTTEVTRDKERPNEYAHPHFHVILMVKPSYFSHGYVKHMDWVRAWGECLRVDYLPNVDIRTVKPKAKDLDDPDKGIKSAIAETLKYAIKPEDMIGDESLQAVNWFHEYTRQVFKLRFVASGGALKNALKADDKITDQDMITADQDPQAELIEKDTRRLNFTYLPTKKGYFYNPKYNT